MTLLQILFGFEGRVRRRVWWFYWLGVFVFAPVFAALSAAMGTLGDPGFLATGILLVAIVPALIWSALAVSIKRWHDRDKTGAWFLIWFIPLPLIGPVWTLIECGFLAGTPGPNRYGPEAMTLAGTAEIFG